MISRSSYKVSCAAALLAVTSVVAAGPMTYIDPDRLFDGETELTKAFYATTLAIENDWCYGEYGGRIVSGVPAREGLENGLVSDGELVTAPVATTGRLVIGSVPCASQGEITNAHSLWGPGELVAKFSRLAYSVEVDFIFDNLLDTAQRVAFLRAYDSCGNILKEVMVTADTRAPVSTKTAGIYFDRTAQIAKVTFGGDSYGAQVDNIQAHFNAAKKRGSSHDQHM
jgi:hypothetical protein